MWFSLFSECVGKQPLKFYRIRQPLPLLLLKFKIFYVFLCVLYLPGASRIRKLPPDQFCKCGFVIGKAYQAGFGNEMYKLLTAAALSVMLNRSLIIGQTRHIGSFLSLILLFFVFLLQLTLYEHNSFQVVLENSMKHQYSVC